MSNGFLMNMAYDASKKSTCRRRQVGAILVSTSGVIQHAANGSPGEVLSCILRGECKRDELGVGPGTRHELCNAVHAEQRVIINALRTGVKLRGGTLYVTHKPCVICAKLCIEVGITEIFYSEDYPDDISDELLKLANIKLQKI